MLVSGHNLRFFLQCQFCSEDFISLLQASNYAERLSIYLFRESVAFSVLTLLVGRQEEHLACKNWVIGRWCDYLSGVRCRLFAYGRADATVIPKPHHLMPKIIISDTIKFFSLTAISILVISNHNSSQVLLLLFYLKNILNFTIGNCIGALLFPIHSTQSTARSQQYCSCVCVWLCICVGDGVGAVCYHVNSRGSERWGERSSAADIRSA